MTTYTIRTAALSQDGDRKPRTFEVSTDGGYVWTWDDEGHRRQVCDRLQWQGDTLWATGATLRRTITRHARLARYDVARFKAR